MKPAVWTIIGLVVDIVGVFLLSVEAIKLENLAKLRDRLIVGLRTYFESPRMFFPNEHDEGGSSDKNIDWSVNRRRGFNGNGVLYYGFHLIVPACLVFGMETLRRRLSLGEGEWFWVLWWQWDSGWKWLPFTLAVLLFFLVAPYTVGCWGHTIIEKVTNGVIWVLRRIESRTPTGGVGILGFLLIFIAFIFQIVGVLSTI